MSKTDKRQTRRGGFYWIEGRPYVTVTTILKVIAKPALRWWYGKEVYLAMVADPTLSQKEALAAPYQTSKTAMGRGTAVHDIVEAWKNIDKVVGQEGAYQGYAKAFQKWLGDNRVEIVENERTVISEKHKYAGTLDILAKINSDELPTIVDVKTGKDLYPEVHLQLSAYREALKEQGIETEGTAALLLKEDGTYKYETGSNKFEAFLAAKTLYEGLNAEKLEKMEYESSS